MIKSAELVTRRRLMAALPGTLMVGVPSHPALPVLPDFPVLNVAAVPYLNAAGQQAYRDFLLMDVPRAFAVASDGHSGAAGAALSPAAARQQAVAVCGEAGGRDPRIYAEDLAVVWTAPPGPVAGGASILPHPALTRPPGPPNSFGPPPPALIATWNYSFAPDTRFFWRGPGTARGLYIWAHGSTADPQGLQPPPHVRAFNNAGFDIVRFDRVPNADDVERAAGWLRSGIGNLRAMGWRFVVAGGHSRGGWNVLQMLKTANLADLAIADSPAAHGVASGFFLSSQTDDLRQIVASVPQTRTKLVFIQFSDDPFIGDAQTRVRLIERLRPQLGGLLVIDRPAGFSGHLAAAELGFAERFSGALLALA
jgi:hypothetical protein